MKYIFYYLAIFVLGITVLNSCDTDENGPMPNNIEDGCLAYMKLDETSSGLINLADVDAFKFAGSIDLVFEPDFDKLELVVVFNKDFANQYTLVDNITSTPHNFSVSLTDIINAVPALTAATDIQIGDTFTFFVNSTSNGKKYPIYVVAGGKGVRTIGSGLIQAMNNTEGADALADVTIGVPCSYSQANVIGSYRAVSPASDWNVNGNVTITADPTDPFVVYVAGLETIDGVVEDRGPLKMIIDPNSYNVTAVKTVLASVVTWEPSYTNMAYEGSGALNTCNGTYEMDFQISVDQGIFNTYGFVLTKNP